MRRGRAGRPAGPFVVYWLPALAYVGLVLFIGTRPYLRGPIEFHESDKIYHLLEYGGLGLVVARALRAAGPRWGRAALAWLAISCGVLVGTTDEYLQSFTPGRESSAFDLMADTAGVALAQLLHRTLARD